MSQEKTQAVPESMLFQIPPELAVDVVKSHVLKKVLRTNGVGSIIWGIVNVVIGVRGAIECSRLNYILAALGIGLICVGVYTLCVKTRKAHILLGVALAGVACWNIGLAATGSASSPVLAVVLGLLQAYWTYRTFSRGREFDLVSGRLSAVSDDHIAVLNAEIDSIWRLSEKSRPDVVSAQVETFVPGKWKLALGRDRLLFLSLPKSEAVFMDRPTVVPIVLKVAPKRRGSVEIDLPFTSKNRKCTFKAKSLDRLLEWAKKSTDGPANLPIL